MELVFEEATAMSISFLSLVSSSELLVLPVEKSAVSSAQSTEKSAVMSMSASGPSVAFDFVLVAGSTGVRSVCWAGDDAGPDVGHDLRNRHYAAPGPVRLQY